MTASPAVDTPGDSPTAVFRRTLHLPTLTPPLRLTLLGADASSRDPQHGSSSSSSSSSSTSTSRVWSSTHPLPRHLPFLANLHLRTILALTPKHPFSEVPALEAWSTEHNVQVRHIPVSKWKDDGASSLTRSVIEDTLPILLDRAPSPLLVISTAPQLLAALLGLLRLIQGYDLEKGVLPEMARALRNGLEGEAEEEDRVGCEKWVRGWAGKEVSVRLQKERVNDWVWPQGTPLSLLRGAGMGKGKGHSSSLDEGERAGGGVNGVPAQGQAHLHAPYRSSTVASLPTVVASGSSSPPSVVHPYLKIKFHPEAAKDDVAPKAKVVPPAAREPTANASQASHNEGEASGGTAAAVISKEGSATENPAEDASGLAPSASGSSTSASASASSSSAVDIPSQLPPAHAQPNLPPLYTSTASSSSAIPSGPSSAPTPTIPLPPATFSPDPNPSAPAAPPGAAPRRTHGRKRSLTISEGRSFSKGPEAEARMGRMTDAAAAAAIACSGIDIDGGGAARRLQLGQRQQTDDQDEGLGRPASLPVGSTSVVGMGVAPLDAGSGGGGTGRGRGRNAGGGADRRPDLAFLDVTPPTSLNIAVHGDGEGADAEAMPRTPTQLNRSPSGSRSSSGGQWATRRRPSDDTLVVEATDQAGLQAQDMTPTASRTSMSAAAGAPPVSAASALWRRRRRSSAAAVKSTAAAATMSSQQSGEDKLSSDEDGDGGDTTPTGVPGMPVSASAAASSSSSSFLPPTTPRPPLSRSAGHGGQRGQSGEAEQGENHQGDEEDDDDHHLTPKAQPRPQPTFGSVRDTPPQGAEEGGDASLAGGQGPATLTVSGVLASDRPSDSEQASSSSQPLAQQPHAQASGTATGSAPTGDVVVEPDEEGDATVRQDEFLSRGGGEHPLASSASTSAPVSHSAAAAIPGMAKRPIPLHAPQPGRPAMMHSQTGPPSSPVPADDDDEEEEEGEEEEEDDEEEDDDASHPISAGLEALDLA